MENVMDKVVLAMAMLLSLLFVGCVFEPYGDAGDRGDGGYHRYDTGEFGAGSDHDEDHR
jgi:hypothetical protein